MSFKIFILKYFDNVPPHAHRSTATRYLHAASRRYQSPLRPRASGNHRQAQAPQSAHRFMKFVFFWLAVSMYIVLHRPTMAPPVANGVSFSSRRPKKPPPWAPPWRGSTIGCYFMLHVGNRPLHRGSSNDKASYCPQGDVINQRARPRPSQ